MVEAIVAKHGRRDMAVNNAGISNENKTLAESDSAAFRGMIETNVLGLYYCMKAEIQQMLRQGGGSIVNLASIAGLNGIPWAGPYAATKHAVVGTDQVLGAGLRDAERARERGGSRCD
jgi:NAD(P)-dependent dehydrogenase (short-subunit alcohol dehydrogenase family)